VDWWAVTEKPGVFPMSRIKSNIIMKIVKPILLISLFSLGISSSSPAVEQEVTCVKYSIQCDAGSFNGTICGRTTSEIVGKVLAIADIVCQ